MVSTPAWKTSGLIADAAATCGESRMALVDPHHRGHNAAGIELAEAAVVGLS